jgi:tetratricopeptide (TPR) repeat protein
LACAQVLLDTDPTSLKGQKNRFMHEALVFLNEDNYCSDLFSLCVDCHLGSSINACPEEFTNVNKGKLTHKKAQKIKEKICNYTVRNGKQIKVLCKQIDDKTIMAFCFETQKSKQLDERNAIYQRALKAYNNQDYKNAKKLFQQVMEKHGEGPDLWNDMAITYYKLDEYENCIEMCRKVLNSGEHKEYAKACYNAGRAYEDQGNYERALKNYTSALEFYNKYGIADKDLNVNYESIYNKSIKRVQEQINKTPTKKTIKPKQNKNNKNKANKAKAFVLAGLVVANKNQRRQYTKTTNKSRAY